MKIKKETKNGTRIMMAQEIEKRLYAKDSGHPLFSAEKIEKAGIARKDVLKNPNNYPELMLTLADEQVEDISDTRLESWLELEKQRIGYLKTVETQKDMKFKIEFQIEAPLADLTGSGKIDCGKYEKNWIATYSFRTDIDDYIIINHFFLYRPKKNDILDGCILSGIENEYSQRKKPMEFQCWECGRQVHFCDINTENIQERWNFYIDHYCGC